VKYAIRFRHMLLLQIKAVVQFLTFVLVGINDVTQALRTNIRRHVRRQYNNDPQYLALALTERE
jgi:hypothetical protein